MLSLLPHLLLPILYLTAFFLYFRRGTTGLERHLRPLGFGFFAITLWAAVDAARFFLTSSPQPQLATLASPFNVLWSIEHLLLLLGTVLIARWVFSYLLKQFHTQVFMVLTTSVVIIFLISGLAFSTLLVKSLEKEKLEGLKTGSQIVANLIETRQAELLATAETIAQNSNISAALAASNSSQLAQISQSFLLRQKTTSVIITDSDFKVVARAAQPEMLGDTLPSSPLTARLLAGQPAVNIYVLAYPAPQAVIQAAAIIPALGFVFVEDILDNTYLDHLRDTSGLATSIYIDNRLAATSLLNPDHRTRPIGLPAPRESFPWSGQTSIAGVHYLGAFTPLSDLDSNPVATLFVGSPATSLLTAAGAALQTSFILAAILLVLSLLPAYLISNYISRQI